MQDVYAAAEAPLPFTRKIPSLASTIDFVWASKHMQTEALYWPIPRKDYPFLMQHSLPNKSYPSDHLPVGVLLSSAPCAVVLKGVEVPEAAEAEHEISEGHVQRKPTLTSQRNFKLNAEGLIMTGTFTKKLKAGSISHKIESMPEEEEYEDDEDDDVEEEEE